MLSGSMIPIRGRKDRWAIPVFASIESRSKIATPVVSLPVPAVVGIQIMGLIGPGPGFPLPIGELT